MRRWRGLRMFARCPDEFIHARTASLLCGWPMAIFSATGREVWTNDSCRVIHSACSQAVAIKFLSTFNGGNPWRIRS